jgi:anti-sigma factor (TIGR02949 family)
MKCNEAAALVAAHADGEVDRFRGHSLRKHLQGCAECSAQYDAIVQLRKQLRSEVPYYRAPPALQERVVAALDAAQAREDAPPRRSGERWSWIGAGALAGCAATLCAWVIGTAVLEGLANEDLAVEATTAHVRATLGDHLIEVASSDQHTVKPWLSARLDYSPPVPDLAQDGFVLVGGRLDYLARQHVATLVYRYRLHVIDVFVRPESSRASWAVPRSVRGFNVARATGSSMEWVAVSDVSPDVLSAFVGTLARGGAPR